MVGYWSPVDPPVRRNVLVGVDLGQARDPSAVIVVERKEAPEGALYDIGHVERLPLNTLYPAVVAHVCNVVEAILADRPKPDLTLVIDRSSVGRAVGDMFTVHTVRMDPVLVTITPGDTVTRADDGGWRVPKRELASVVQKVLQTKRFRFASDEPLLQALKDELAGFRAKIKLSGNISFEAGEDWRSAPHDDLVLALALAVWAGESGIVNGGWLEDVDYDAFFRGAGLTVV